VCVCFFRQSALVFFVVVPRVGFVGIGYHLELLNEILALRIWITRGYKIFPELRECWHSLLDEFLPIDEVKIFL